MSSASQAQLAASQTATQAQAEANANALAFAKEVYGYEKDVRNPYVQGGAAGMNELMLLLGLLPNGTTGGGTLSNGTSGGGTFGGSRTSTGSGRAPGGGPLPSSSPTPSSSQGLTNDPYQTWINNEASLGRTTGSAPITQTPSVTMQAPDGSMRLVPSSLVPYFQESGLTVVG